MTEEEQQQAAQIEHLANQEPDPESIGGEWEPGNEEQQQRPGTSTADAIAPLLLTTFGLLAKVRGPHWAISPEVAQEAAESYGECLDYYYPGGTLPPWLGAGVTSVMLFGPPLMMEAHIKRQAEQSQEEPPKDEKKDKGLDDGD